jgi:iron complex outermembrane receptor protein
MPGTPHTHSITLPRKNTNQQSTQNPPRNLKLKLKAIPLAVALLCAGTVHAQNATLSTVSVTASPIIEDNRVDKFSSFSTVVTENQLRDQNAVDLASALRHTPGVEISRYNPVGSFGGDQGGAVYIRGMGVSRPGSEIKTYVDGVPVYMGVWNHPLLDLLPVNGMQSVTINKSPQPQINGNNFASINLETKRATEDGIHGSGRVSAGSFGTVVEQVDLAGRSGALDFSLAQGYAKSNGHRANSDGELNNLMGRLGAKLSEHWSVGVSFLSVDNKAKDPYDNRLTAPATAPRYESSTNMISAFVSHQHGDWRGEFRVYDNQGKGNLYDDARPMVGWGTFLTNFSMSGLRWKEQFSPWAGGTVVLGIDQDKVSGEVNGPNTGGWTKMPEFRVTSPHLALSQNIELSKNWALVPSAGVRTYNHSQYASRTAPHAGVSLVSEQLTIFANVSRGINYPGLEGAALQAAIPFMFAGTTWKKLSPEELDHQEIGVKFAPTEATQIDLSLFRDEVKNRYAYDLSFASTTFYNLGTYRTNGAELSVKQKIARDWAVFGGLTLLDPSISNLPYTPKTAFTAGVNGQLGPIRVAVDAQYQSEVFALSRDRNTLNPNIQRVGAYTVVNARLSYPVSALGKKGEVFIAAENLFDRDYAYRPGYPMPGRNGQLGVSASF